MRSNPGETTTLTAPPWEFSVAVPASIAGPFPIAAVAKDAGGTYYSARIDLEVVPSAELLTLSVSPANVTLVEPGFPQPLAVEGRYADGIMRDLTSPGIGTVYESDDPSIVTVSAEGLIEAQGNGTATLIVTNGQVSAVVTVVVEMPTDLAIDQTATPSPVLVGEEITYGLPMQNKGGERALELRVTDGLPEGTSFVSAAGNGWSCIEAGGIVTCSRSALEAGIQSEINLVVTAPDAPGVVTNQITVATGAPDAFIDDNVSTLTTTVASAIYTLSVSRQGTGEGTVTSEPEGIDCGTACTENYPVRYAKGSN